MGLEWFATETAYRAGWIIAIVLGGLHIFSLRRVVFPCDVVVGHQHKWKNVVYMGGKGDSYEVDQVCECKARRKVTYWPPPEHEE